MRIFSNDINRITKDKQNKPSTVTTHENIKSENAPHVLDSKNGENIFMVKSPSLENISDRLEAQSRRYNNFLDVQNQITQ